MVKLRLRLEEKNNNGRPWWSLARAGQLVATSAAALWSREPTHKQSVTVAQAETLVDIKGNPSTKLVSCQSLYTILYFKKMQQNLTMRLWVKIIQNPYVWYPSEESGSLFQILPSQRSPLRFWPWPCKIFRKTGLSCRTDSRQLGMDILFLCLWRFTMFIHVLSDCAYSSDGCCSNGWTSSARGLGQPWTQRSHCQEHQTIKLKTHTSDTNGHYMKQTLKRTPRNPMQSLKRQAWNLQPLRAPGSHGEVSKNERFW